MNFLSEGYISKWRLVFLIRSLCSVYQTKQMFFLIYDTCTTVDLISEREFALFFHSNKLSTMRSISIYPISIINEHCQIKDETS